MDCVREIGTEILYAIAMTVSPHRLKNYLWLMLLYVGGGEKKKPHKFKLEDAVCCLQ